jgi:hypothetical protein
MFNSNISVHASVQLVSRHVQNRTVFFIIRRIIRLNTYYCIIRRIKRIISVHTVTPCNYQVDRDQIVCVTLQSHVIKAW